MTDSASELPDDIERLKAMLLAERADKARLAHQNDRLLHMLRQLRRAQFGRKSERLSEDQLNLGLEDLETVDRRRRGQPGEGRRDARSVAQGSA